MSRSPHHSSSFHTCATFRVVVVVVDLRLHYRSGFHALLSMLRFRSSVFALYCNEPPISAQLLAFLRVFCMMEGKKKHSAREYGLFALDWPWWDVQ